MMELQRALSNLFNFIRRPIPFMHSLWQKNGDFFSLYLGHKKFHFVYSPKIAAEFLCHRANNYRKSRLVFDKIEPITGKQGLVQLEGDQWQQIRKLTNVLFHKQSLGETISIFDKNAKWVIQNIHEKINYSNNINISELMITYTLRTIIEIIMGIESDKEILDIANIFIALNRACGQKLRSAIHLPLIIPTQQNKLIKNLHKELIHHISLILSSLSQASAQNFQYLLKTLSRQDLSRSLIFDQITTFLFAGFETTAASLTFTFYLLSRYPELQQKIYDEVKAYLPKDRLATIEEIRNLNFTTAVYRESLRLYPPAWILAREAVQKDMIQNTQIFPGDNIIISIRSIQRHPEFWRNPNQFLPERFYPNNEWPSKVDKFAFIPFGVGERICSGTQLAMLEAPYIIARLIENFEFTQDPIKNLQTEAMITLHPKHNVFLNVKRRDHGR